MSRLISLKTQIRTRDYQASRRFYTQVLGLRILEEWKASTGFIAGFGDDAGGGVIEVIEVIEVDVSHETYDEAFTYAVLDPHDEPNLLEALSSWSRDLRVTSSELETARLAIEELRDGGSSCVRGPGLRSLYPVRPRPGRPCPAAHP